LSIDYTNVYTQGLADERLSEAFERELVALRAGGAIACPHVINGRDVSIGAVLERRDPVDRTRVVARLHEGGPEAVRLAVDAARRGWQEWRRVPLDDRCAILLEAAARMSQGKAELAALMTHEVGKTRADTVAEVDECCALVEWFVAQIREHHGYVIPMRPPTPAASAEIVKLPYGVFGVIAPFNFPLAIATTMAGAALLTGNTVVYKPSALTPACGQAFHAIFEGLLPPGALQLVHGGAETGRALTDSDVDGLAFTGSAAVGIAMAQRLSQPPHIRPLIAEMGGKNPVVVSDSVADVATAAQATARSAFGMTGQKCVSCSRAIVAANVHDEFVEALAAFTSQLAVGDPLDPGRFAGPLVKDASLERFASAVTEARDAGGRLACGGSVMAGDGNFAELTVVTDLPLGHRLTRDELFVPLLCVTKVDDLDAAIDEANAVQYGLSAGVYSADPAECTEFLDRIEAGIVMINSPSGATTGIWPGNQSMAGWKATGSTGNGGFGPYYLAQYLREQSRTSFQVGAGV
jgi:1-pyrroline-5-carboxylate dehydrogenase